MPKNVGINSWLCSSCSADLQQKYAMESPRKSLLLQQSMAC